MRTLQLFAILTLFALPVPLEAADCTAYGAGVDVTETTAVAALTADPEAFEGRTVRVEGEVREVCPMAGCWMTLIPEGADTGDLRVKVDDGEIVFPLSARGRRAAAQGVVEVFDMTRDEYVAHHKHLSEETGEAFDETTIGDGPYRRVQVKATGAEVCD